MASGNGRVYHRRRGFRRIMGIRPWFSVVVGGMVLVAHGHQLAKVKEQDDLTRSGCDAFFGGKSDGGVLSAVVGM